MNNINTPDTSKSQSEKMAWVAPVLYKEDWVNTLTSDQAGIENTTTSFS